MNAIANVHSRGTRAGSESDAVGDDDDDDDDDGVTVSLVHSFGVRFPFGVIECVRA